MKIILYIIPLYFLLFNQILFSQEWKNSKTYKNATGKDVLQKGSWLKKDRLKNTDTWKQANKYNLSLKNGNLKYKSISEIRDFYLWFDEERKKNGIEIKTAGILAIVAGQLSKVDHFFVRAFLIRNKEVVWFAHEGSLKVFAYAFPLFKEVYFSLNHLKGKEASDWDVNYIQNEQCIILDPIYEILSSRAICKLERIAKGKGIYCLGVKNKLKFEGHILDCTSRYEHAFKKLYPYYYRNTL